MRRLAAGLALAVACGRIGYQGSDGGRPERDGATPLDGDAGDAARPRDAGDAEAPPDSGDADADTGCGLEACNGVDDDCDGDVDEAVVCLGAASCLGGRCRLAGAHETTAFITGPSETLARSVAVSPDGHLVVVGDYRGELDVGPRVERPAAGGRDAFARVYTPGLAAVAAHYFLSGGTGDEYARAAAVAADGTVWIGGSFDTEVDFGAGARAADRMQGYVVGLDPAFGYATDLVFPDPDASVVEDLAPFAGGGVLAAGEFGNAVTIGTTVVAGTASYGNIFVASVSSGGGASLFRAVLADFAALAPRVVASPSHGVLLGGQAARYIDFGGGERETVDAVSDGFVAAYSATAEHRWDHLYGDLVIADRVTALAVRSDGSVAVAGYFRGSLDLGGGPRSTGGTDTGAYVVALDADGGFLWDVVFEASAISVADVAVLPDDTVVAAVNAVGAVDLPGFAPVAGGGGDGYVVAYGREGDPLWLQAFTGLGGQSVSALAVAPGDRIVVVGTYVGGTSAPWGSDVAVDNESFVTLLGD